MKETRSDENPEATATLRGLIEEISIAMITTATPDGALRSRPMITLDAGGETELWFFTSVDSGIVHDIEEEQAVNVAYADAGRSRYVSVTGQASLVRDRAKLQELWDRRLERYFGQGLRDPKLALLRVRIESAEYWNEEANEMERLGHVKVGIRATRASG